MFDLFYIGENPELQEQFPFAKRVSSAVEIIPNTKMYWLVESEFNLISYDIFQFRPPEYDHRFHHVWKFSGSNHGGVHLIPKTNPSGFKLVDHQVCVQTKQYPVYLVKDPTDISQAKPESWLIDQEYQIETDISWKPDYFEQNMIHVFHVKNQLNHKYPAALGGVYWYPAVPETAQVKIHDEPLDTVLKKYPVYLVKDPTDISQAKPESWLIDGEYAICDLTQKGISWVPDHFERNMIHIFHVKDQLKHKYPESMGGVYWYPADPETAQVKIHKVPLDIELKKYPVYLVKDPADISQAKPESWLIDQEYQIETDISWIPDYFEKNMIHVFHVKDQLKHKYPESMGGVYWYPTDPETAQVKIHNETLDTVLKKYPVYLVKDPTDASQAKPESWLVDKEYQIETDIDWRPDYFEKNMIHVFHVKDQLKHKYPESMGGVYWYPSNPATAQIKIHKKPLEFYRNDRTLYESESIGREATKSDWFWVVDPDVDVLDDFDFDFVPDIWDRGKMHVWQKLNPITGRQYDYSGVMLCPKVPAEKGRPKYMRTAACKQREYPVYYLDSSDYTEPLTDAYKRFSEGCDLGMFWVVDAYTQLDPEFKFDYYPTQWDKHCIHVFLNEDGEHKNVRLVPKTLFEESEYSDEEIANNTFNDLKLINTVASLRPTWPIINLDTFHKDYFISKLESYRDGNETGKPEPFVWVVDPYVDTNIKNSPIKEGFLPKITDVNKIHCWQKVNDITGQVHGYGGLRLWPTTLNYSKLTTDALKLNKIRNVHYVRREGCISNTFDIVFLSYKEYGAEHSFEKLKDKICEISTTSAKQINLLWVKDIEGIFEAHKQAAQQVTSKMFWVIDADAEIMKDFNFSYIPDVYDEEVVHVWNSRNPITGMEYGYGGVKLLPTSLVNNATSWGLDFTTGLSSRFKAMPEVSCVTRFNTDAYSTWRSAFRECVKLALKDDAESKQRLEGWLSPLADADFRDEAKRGAEEGKAFALKHKDNLTELNNINNFDWLYEQYTGNSKS